MIHLVIGGARSGKSNYAEQLIQTSVIKKQKKPVYLATGVALDGEMADRIIRHKQQRIKANESMPYPWQLKESPLHIAQDCQQYDGNHILLIDCLSLWLNNHLQRVTQQEQNDDEMHQYLICEREVLLTALTKTKCDVVLVSNEVGMGVVPMGKETRWFVDHLGWINQAIAQLADRVTLMTAGIPLNLKVNASEKGELNHG